MTASLPPNPRDTFLTTEQVASRYTIDKRTARRIADEAGAFVAGRGLLVSLQSLLEWEQRKRLERRAAMRAGEVTRAAPTRSRDVGLDPLPSGQWWQTEGDDVPPA